MDLADTRAPSPDQVYDLEKVYVLVTAIPYFVLVWDWLSNLSKEYRLFLKNGHHVHNGNGHGHPGGNGLTWSNVFSIKNTFIASRYITLAWCTFVVVVLANAGSHPDLCSWAKYFPYGYSTTMLAAHLVMVLRMYSIYERRKKILIFLLVLAGIDYALQMSANHAATAIYANSQNPNLAVCFLIPTSLLYALVFISPTIFHHIVLVMTLYKSIQHIRATRAGGIRSIMHIVQRDQILFVLAICLINFANLVLVLQRSSWPYRLINQLPAAAFTQIFLSRIIFNLKHIQKKLVSANVSPVITTLPLSPSGRIRGEFTFGISGSGSGRRESDGSGKDDLELGEDFKSSSLSPNSAYNTSNYKKSKKELLEEEQDNHTKADFIGNTNNVFTLRFDPTSRRTPGTPSSPIESSYPTVPKGGKENDDDEDDDKVEFRKVKGGEMYSLGSYRLPPPTPLNEDKTSPFFITAMKDPSDSVPPPSHSPHEQQKSSEEFVDPVSPSVTTMSGSTVFKPPTSPSPSYGKGQGHHQQRSSSSRRMELSPYFETPKEEKDAGLSSTTGEMPSTQHHTFNQILSHPTLSIDTKSAASVATSPKKKEETSTTTATRSSFETLGGGRRASTIDEHQRITDWEPPSAWGTSASPRASPIPFTERRLSSSVARNSLSLQRSRQASTGNIVRSTDSFGATVSRPSFENASSREQQRAADIAVVGAGAGAGAASSTGPGIGERQRGSACYASIFSFDNDENQLEEVRDGEDEEHGEIKPASGSSKK